MSSEHGTPAPEQQQQPPALLQRLSVAPIDPPEFEEATVEACEQIVVSFRKGDITKTEASYRLVKILDLDEAQDDEEEYAQRNEALTTFLEQLDSVQREHQIPDRLRSRTREATPEITENENFNDDAPAEALAGRSSGKRRTFEADYSADPFEYAPPRKRKAVDESLFPFLQDSGSSLCPELQRTLLLKENYTRDLPLCRQSIMSRPNAPGLPSNVWTSILSNEYVDLSKVFGAIYSTGGDTKQAHQFGDFEIITDNIKTTRTIAQHGHWAIAWSKYVAGVTFAYPHRDAELKGYAEHITNAFSAVDEASHRKVVDYDKAIRTEVGRLNNILLTDFSRFNHIYTMYINSSGAGTSSSASRSEGTRAKSSAAGNTSSRSLSNEICKRFNSGNCGDARSCKYRHACSNCSQRSHSLIFCPSKSEDVDRKL